MRTGAFKKAGGLLMAAVLMLSLVPSAMAAEPESVKEFRNGKTTMVNGGYAITLVLQEDGCLWGFGNNDESGLVKNKTYPKSVLTNVKSVDLKASTNSVPLAIKRDGTLWYTGMVCKMDVFGMEVTNREYVKGFVKLTDQVVSAASGVTSENENVIYAVKDNGELWQYKFVATVDKESFNGSEAVQGSRHFEMQSSKLLDSVTKVTCGIDHALALKKDGSVWAWGNTLQGQIGNGIISQNSNGGYDTDNVVNKPIQILTDAKDIFAGDFFSAAIKQDGSLWVWGQLPSGNQGTPKKVLDGAKKVVSDLYSTTIAILKDDGTLALWGGLADNVYFGKEVMAESDTKRIVQTTLTDVKDVTLFDQMLFYVKSDGSLFALGNNSAGYFGAESWITTPLQLTGHSAASIVPPPTAQTATAKPTASKILLDGNAVSLDAYNINSNNYSKIRDVAKLLNGTGKQFEVTWDKTLQAVSMTSSHAYTAVGGELAKGDGENKTATLNTAKIYLDGKELSLTAYNIGGNNYIKLRDLGQTFDFGVSFDSAVGAVRIDTTKGYTPE